MTTRRLDTLRKTLSTAGLALLVAVFSYTLSGVLVTSHPAFALSSAKSFSITSTVYAKTCTKTATAKLFPGEARCLSVSVHDPLSVGIHVTSLSAAVTSFSPSSTTPKLTTCKTTWLTLGTLTHTFTVAPGTTHVVTTTIELTTTGTNQDNCENGTFHLAFSGAASYTDTTSTQLGASRTGHSATLSATVAPGNPTSDPYGPGSTTAPVHHVVFYSCGATASCTTKSAVATKTLKTLSTTTLLAKATTTVTGLSAGTHYFEAVYPATGTSAGTFTGSVSNIVSVTVPAAPTPTPPPAGLPPTATFRVEKSDIPGTGTPVVPGETIDYAILVKNLGSASGTATVTDHLPTNVTLTGTPACSTVATGDTCAASVTGSALTITVDLAAGDSVKMTVDATVASSDTTSVTNTATIAQGTCTTTACTSSVTNPVVVLSVVKSSTPSSGSVVAHTARVTYTLRATDSGSAATTPVTLSDTVPAGATYVAGSATCGGVPGCRVSEHKGTLTWSGVVVEPGTTNAVSLSFAVVVDKSDPTGAKVTNTATFTNDGTPGCAASTCTTNTVTVVVTGKVSSATHSPPPVSPIPAATTPHTGEPFAGAGPIDLAAFFTGLTLLGAGEWLRRRQRRTAGDA